MSLSLSNTLNGFQYVDHYLEVIVDVLERRFGHKKNPIQRLWSGVRGMKVSHSRPYPCGPSVHLSLRADPRYVAVIVPTLRVPILPS